MIDAKNKFQRANTPSEIGVLPLRNSVLFPHAIMPISVGRRKTLNLIEDAERGPRLIGVVSQRDPAIDDPNPFDLYRYGTIARIIKVVRLSESNINLIIQGLDRIKVIKFERTEPYLVAQIEKMEERFENTLEIQALTRNLYNQFQKFLSITTSISGEHGEMVLSSGIDNPSRLADMAASVLNISVDEKIGLLEKADLKSRITRLTEIVTREIDLTELGSKIQSQVMDEVGRTQKQFYLREQMKAIQKELGEEDERTQEITELKKKIEEARMPADVKSVAEKELDRLAKMPPHAAEYTVSRTYLDWLITLPWSIYTEDKIEIKDARTILDEDHYNLKDVKERILEYLAVRHIRSELKGPILCFVGPPGVGKTSLGRSIARAMGRKFTRISLGGIRDEAEIRGHRRTYIGSLPGRIIQGIRRAGTRNPVFMLDEIDKVGTDFRGDPSSALLEVLDPEQNFSFSDHYLEVPFDLSQVFFITTANILDTIPPALKDRMEILRLPGYSEEEKLEIAKRHLIPRQLKEHGLTPDVLEFTDDAIMKMILEYTREAGMRNLERQIATVCRKVACQLVEQGKVKEAEIEEATVEGKKDQEAGEKPEDAKKIIKTFDTEKVVIDAERLVQYIGPMKFFREVAERTDRSGVSIGLAWTSTGGEILFIESTKMRGKGSLNITGHLGDVMKESAQAALSFIKSSSQMLGIEERVFEKHDFHIHVPSGAIPKDGPSAGVAIFVSLTSLLLNRPVPSNIAMTGEITLRGKVLPVGGIKEKVLAAKQAGITEVIIPDKNENDLQDLSETARKALKFHMVREIGDILKIIFGIDEFNQKGKK
ncbi:MAG: endopeptidase La [Acidobacteriota bacterium]